MDCQWKSNEVNVLVPEKFVNFFLPKLLLTLSAELSEYLLNIFWTQVKL